MPDVAEPDRAGICLLNIYSSRYGARTQLGEFDGFLASGLVMAIALHADLNSCVGNRTVAGNVGAKSGG